MINLYDVVASGNCHKVRLMLSILGVEYQSVPVSLPDQEQMTPEYLAMNPLGKVPVLDDDGEVVRDSQAILCYLARKYGDGAWLPMDAQALGHVMEWLSFAANEMLHGCALARALVLFNREGDLDAARTLAAQCLEVLDGHLKGREWLVGATPTVADIACYVYAGLVHEGGVDASGHVHVLAWFDRVETLPGYVGMPGLPMPR